MYDKLDFRAIGNSWEDKEASIRINTSPEQRDEVCASEQRTFVIHSNCLSVYNFNVLGSNVIRE